MLAGVYFGVTIITAQGVPVDRLTDSLTILRHCNIVSQHFQEEITSTNPINYHAQQLYKALAFLKQLEQGCDVY